MEAAGAQERMAAKAVTFVAPRRGGRGRPPLHELSVSRNLDIVSLTSIGRRRFLKSLGAVAIVSVVTGAEENKNMWGMIAKITVVPSKRDEMIGVLKASVAEMPGYLSYVVAKDAADENILWVSEVWDSQASHQASLLLPAVKDAMTRGKPLVANFERVAVTTPVWGLGLPAGH